MRTCSSSLNRFQAVFTRVESSTHIPCFRETPDLHVYALNKLIVIPAFFFRKKGILISYQSRSVCPCVRASVTFLVNVSPSKP